MAEEDKIALLIEALLSNESVKKFVDDSRAAGEQAGQALGEGGKKGGHEGAAGIHEQEAALGQLKEKIQETVLEYLSWKEAGKFLWESFKEAASVENNLAKLDGAMRNFTKATEEEVKAAHEYLEVQELAYGKVQGEVIPAFQQLISTTGDVTSAQYLMNIALDVSKSTHVELGAAVGKLTQYMIAGKVAGRDEFGKMLMMLEKQHKDVKDATERHRLVLHDLSVKMAESAGHINTTTNALDQQKVRWEITKEAIGAQLLQFRDGLIPVFRAVAVGIAHIVEGWTLLGEAVTMAAEHFVDVGRALDELAHGNFKAAFQEMQRAGEGWADDMDKAAAKAHEGVIKVEKAWDDTAKASKLSADEQVAAEKKVAEVMAAMAKAPKEPKEKKKKDPKGEKYGPYTEEFEQYKRAKEDEFEIAKTALMAKELGDKEYSKAYIGLLKERLKDNTLDAKERIKIERQIVEEQIKLHKGELADEKKDEKEKENIAKGWERFIKKSETDILKEQIKAIEADLKKYQWSVEEKKKAEKALAALKKQLNMAGLKQGLDVASQAVAGAQQAFGDNKALATAAAIINVLQGVTKAIAQGGIAGVVTGALVLATGMKTVQDIQKTDYSKGAGFDDPQNDMVAELGGQRWAKDFTARFGAGIMRGMGNELGAGSGGSQSTYNYHQYQPGQVNRTTNVHVGAVPLVDTGKDHSMRELASVVRTYINLDAERDAK